MLKAPRELILFLDSPIPAINGPGCHAFNLVALDGPSPNDCRILVGAPGFADEFDLISGLADKLGPGGILAPPFAFLRNKFTVCEDKAIFDIVRLPVRPDPAFERHSVEMGPGFTFDGLAC